MDPVNVTARVLLVVLVVATANVLIWLFRQRHAWRVIKPYPFGTRIAVTAPFSRRWESRVQPGDREAIASFRKGFLLNYYLLWAAPVLALALLLTSLSYREYLHAERDLRDTQQLIEQLRQAADETQ